jgi:hypothetical protein
MQPDYYLSCSTITELAKYSHSNIGDTSVWRVGRSATPEPRKLVYQFNVAGTHYRRNNQTMTCGICLGENLSEEICELR